MNARVSFLFAAMCVLWGIPYLLIRVAVRHLDPSVLVLARTAIAAALLLPLAASQAQLRPVLRRWRLVLAFALVEIAAPWWLLSSAEQHLTSSFTGMTIASVPLVGAVVARSTGERERLGSGRVLGLLVGFAGVAALVGLNLGGTNATGLAELAAVVAGYSLGPIIIARHLRDLPALGVISASLGVTAVVYSPIAAFRLPSVVPSASVLASVATLAVICTAIAFIFFFALIEALGSVRAMVFTYLNPAVAAILGVAILGERFTAGMGIGLVLILLGSALAVRPPRPPAPRDPRRREAALRPRRADSSAGARAGSA
jgi:drug/metabolite transporter (DMT)-like permease